MWIFKDFPLNLKVTTWRLSQWVATITFILFIFIYKDQYFGSFHEYNIVFMTPLGFFSLLASLVAQMYVYGGFITNTNKDILVPAAIIIFLFIMELAFSYVMSRLEYNPQWDTYVIRYTMLIFQSVIQFWVYNDVEFKEIPVDELPSLTKDVKK